MLVYSFMPPKKTEPLLPEKPPREHDECRIHPHSHEHSTEWKRCSGQWWCLDCKTWFTGDKCV